MRCALHSMREAEALCVTCGTAVCRECAREAAGRVVCSAKCAEQAEKEAGLGFSAGTVRRMTGSALALATLGVVLGALGRYANRHGLEWGEFFRQEIGWVLLVFSIAPLTFANLPRIDRWLAKRRQGAAARKRQG